jgi:hypothetical protein
MRLLRHGTLREGLQESMEELPLVQDAYLLQLRALHRSQHTGSVHQLRGCHQGVQKLQTEEDDEVNY